MTKIGTILDSTVVRDLKIFCAQEGRKINEVIQNAVVAYLEDDPKKTYLREHALARLLGGIDG